MTARGGPSHLDTMSAIARNLAGAEPICWPAQTQRERRGHSFWPADLYARRIPALYHSDAEEGRDAGETWLWLHYTAPIGDWWVASLDPETGQAYCVRGDGDTRTWAYMALSLLERIPVVERDLNWGGCPAREV